MGMDPNFNDLMQRKYGILQQNADSAATSAGADVTRANASMLNVQQQPGLHQMDNDAAMQRTQYSSDTQNQMNQRDNDTRMSGQSQNYALGQADLGLKAATAAANDQYRRGVNSRDSFDAMGNFRGTVWDSRPSFMDQYMRNANVRGFGLQGFERGGPPPVNQPFVVGENGPETFIPADGGDPIVVGKNGPTVMTVPKPGFVEPNPKTVAQQSPQDQGARSYRSNGLYAPGGQDQSSPRMSGVDAPWAGQSPRRSGLSPEGVVLPQEAPQPQPSVNDQINTKLGPPPAPRYVQIGSGKNAVTMREFNLYDAVERAKQEAPIRAEVEAQNKPDFDPAAAEGRMHNMTDDEAKAFKASLSPAQQKAIYDYTVQRDTMNRMMNASPRRMGLSFIQGDQARAFAGSRGRLQNDTTSHPVQATQQPSNTAFDNMPDSYGKDALRPVYENIIKPAVENSPSASDWWRSARMLAGFGTEEELAQWRARQAARRSLAWDNQ